MYSRLTFMTRKCELSSKCCPQTQVIPSNANRLTWRQKQWGQCWLWMITTRLLPSVMFCDIQYHKKHLFEREDRFCAYFPVWYCKSVIYFWVIDIDVTFKLALDESVWNASYEVSSVECKDIMRRKFYHELLIRARYHEIEIFVFRIFVKGVFPSRWQPRGKTPRNHKGVLLTYK